MSGIEIAGLVLAVIPLFISAIKDYEDHIRPVRVLNYVVYRRELARHRVKLNIEYGLYNSALEELLVDVLPQDELRDMIAQGYGSHWKDAALEDRLKKRLGSVYDRYFFLMEQMQDVMARIASLLDLDIERHGNVSQPNRFLQPQLTLGIDNRLSARANAAGASTHPYSIPDCTTSHSIRVQEEAEVWISERTHTTFT